MERQLDDRQRQVQPPNLRGPGAADHQEIDIELAMAAMLIGVVGIPLGVLAAAKRDRPVDQIARVITLVGTSMPIFWLGLVAIVIFYAWLGWAPPPGRLSARLEPPPFLTGFILVDSLLAGRTDAAVDALKHLALPALVLSSYSLGIITRVMRGGMLEVLGEDYVRTATARPSARFAPPDSTTPRSSSPRGSRRSCPIFAACRTPFERPGWK